jgi:hypothetical protein
LDEASPALRKILAEVRKLNEASTKRARLWRGSASSRCRPD